MFDWKLWRWILTVGLAVLSIYVLIPSLAPKDEAGAPKLPNWWKDTLIERTINLGLDLQGGMHVDLQVEVPAALGNRLGKIGDSIQAEITKRDAAVTSVKVDAGRLIFEAAPDVERQINEIVKELYPEIESTRGPADRLSYKLTESAKRELSDLAVSQALDTIRNRIDQFGVREPEVVRKGDDRIVVQLPGVSDPQRAIDLIQNTAQLEFKLVETGVSQGLVDSWLQELYAAEPTLQTAPLTDANMSYINRKLEGKLPEGTQVLFQRGTDIRGKTPILVQARPLMTGDAIADARVQINTQYNEPYVGIDLDSEGSKTFERITGQYVQRQLAIVLDNVVRSAPQIRERISGGSAQITGAFTMDEARDLAIALRSGALPAPVSIAEKRVVGPTLGKDSIDAGLNSIVVGGALVLVFMFIYYGFAGLIADLALVLNLLIIMGALALFEATLTLPGIAGIVLTIGMSIDANIIIFERIREELRLGKSPKAALEMGYAKAFWTIIDAQVTGLIAAVVLFQFGTGPIKGFAVTLTIGLISSIFTAVTVSKMVFDTWLKKRGRKITVGITVPQAQAEAKGK